MIAASMPKKAPVYWPRGVRTRNWPLIQRCRTTPACGRCCNRLEEAPGVDVSMILKKLCGVSAPRRPVRQALENFPIVLAFDRDITDSFFAERIVGNPAGICHDHNMALAGFGGGQQCSRGIARSLERLLIEIVLHHGAGP